MVVVADKNKKVRVAIQAGKNTKMSFEIRFPDLPAQFFKDKAVTSLFKFNDLGSSCHDQL